MRRLALSCAHAGFPGYGECILYGLPPVMRGAPTIARIATPPRFPQCDTTAALVVAETAERLTLVTLPVAMQATLRAEHLSRIRAAGPVGHLLARQSEAHSDASGLRTRRAT
jgi:hypothetical protein